MGMHHPEDKDTRTQTQYRKKPALPTCLVSQKTKRCTFVIEQGKVKKWQYVDALTVSQQVIKTNFRDLIKHDQHERR
jgi:hypothetical protein